VRPLLLCLVGDEAALHKAMPVRAATELDPAGKLELEVRPLGLCVLLSAG
jgi:hypothetical protein